MASEVCMYPWKYYAKPFEICKNVYYVGNTNVSSHLIDTGEGLILLDTGYPQTLYLLLESIRTLGFDPHDIKYIIHSHAHYDHIGGTPAIVEMTGAKTFMGEDDTEIIEKSHEFTFAHECGFEFFEHFKTDFIMRDNDQISLGKINIDVVSTPGHTPGTMSFFFKIIENGVQYSVGMHGGVGLNTLSKGYLDHFNLSLDRRKDFFDSIEKLKNTEVDIVLGNHPWHNNTFGKYELKLNQKGNNNPFINKNEWMDFLIGTEGTLKNLIEQETNI